MELEDRLIISKPLYISESANPKCGYCKGGKNSFNNFALKSWYELHKNHLDDIQFCSTTVGLQAELLPVEIYDELCNLGFRRSGHFLYKADLLRNCCRLYTIRTNASQLKLSKELKSCVKKFKKKILPEKFVSKPQYKDFVEQLIHYEESSTTFRTRFEPAICTTEKYELFVRYQKHIHHEDDSSLKQFKSFLCESPFSEDVIIGTEEEWDQLNRWRTLGPTEKVKRVGPAHECYYYNEKLIGLAVTDFLPSGISSVYFIWDPDYPKWSLGKLSALRELAILSKINREYYYLGYYIEDCQKMKYKAKYGGEILDVCNNQYVPLSRVEHFIEKGKFFVLDNLREKSLDQEYEEEMKDQEGMSELPFDSKQKFKLDRPLINIAESIYGEHGGAMQSANEAIDKLQDIGIEYIPQLFNDIYRMKPYHDVGSLKTADEFEIDDHDTVQFTNGIYNLPNTIPGLLPLWQILQIVDNGDINRINNKLMVYNTATGQMRVIREFSKESNRTKLVICNVIRLIGLANTTKSLIIM